jgi:hypothetical protein
MSKGRETREMSIDNADFLLLPFPPRFLRSPIHRVQLNLTYLGKKLLLGVYNVNRSLAISDSSDVRLSTYGLAKISIPLPR